ncbi:protein FAM162A [Xenopus laevis]|uniref:Protein FAM162A n=1 Tax=Xenopus laevis TaxID=8355 RepID=A0A8J0U521_XENLA|nr:protein FAM162A [Xenopus laevis]
MWMWGAALRRSGLRSLVERVTVLKGGSCPVPAHTPVPTRTLVIQRWMCSKAQETKAKEPGVTFKVPGHRPTDFEKKILVWGGRFKKQEDIPELVTYDMVEMAKSRVRVKVSYIMIIMTILGCITMVVSGKQAAARHESLASRNLEKKARLKDELQKEISKSE